MEPAFSTLEVDPQQYHTGLKVNPEDASRIPVTNSCEWKL
jgi:hypothetical protein